MQKYENMNWLQNIKRSLITRLAALLTDGRTDGLTEQPLGEILDSRPMSTYTEIFIQIGKLVRKISTDKLFAETDLYTYVKLKRSFLGVSVLVESGNVLTEAQF